MPRPKREEPLETRSIRLTDSEYEKFQLLGGSDWLRVTLGRMTATKMRLAVRNANILQDTKRGLSDLAISEKYGVNRATVWRIRQ